VAEKGKVAAVESVMKRTTSTGTQTPSAWKVGMEAMDDPVTAGPPAPVEAAERVASERAPVAICSAAQSATLAHGSVRPGVARSCAPNPVRASLTVLASTWERPAKRMFSAGARP
jgi:hypothetical protein